MQLEPISALQYPARTVKGAGVVTGTFASRSELTSAFRHSAHCAPNIMLVLGVCADVVFCICCSRTGLHPYISNFGSACFQADQHHQVARLVLR